MEGQRAFATRYRMGDVDWIPSSESLGPGGFHEHVLIWHPPMVPPLSEVFSRLADELADSAKHPFAAAIRNRIVRALWVLEQHHAFSLQGHEWWAAPCVWCGHFTQRCYDGVPPSSESAGWLCEFRICSMCKHLFKRCRFCCHWTGLPVRASQDATQRCQRSDMVLGKSAREYLRAWRFPYELLPEPLQLEWQSFCFGEALDLDVVEAQSRWVKMIVRRALCEDPPADTVLPPRLPEHRDPASENESDGEAR